MDEGNKLRKVLTKKGTGKGGGRVAHVNYARGTVAYFKVSSSGES